MTAATRSHWLFSGRIDLAVFLGSALLSIGALGLGAATGVLHSETPLWGFFPAIVLVDVAHVWATSFRVYFDRDERARRPWLYALTPLGAFVLGAALFQRSEALYWRALAYLAIVHFVRQQVGWVKLYRARAGDDSRLGAFVDLTAIHAATVYPLVFWHTHQPRAFAWLVAGDVMSLPIVVDRIARPLWIAALAAYAIRAVVQRIRGGPASHGKDVVVATTALLWWLGIVHFDSDYAFTATNVFIHGIPYVALVYVHGRRGEPGRARRSIFAYGPWALVGAIWAFAVVEELLWDRAVWHDRAAIFGEGWAIGALRSLVVPLLGTVQLTHYVLDGFIWRRRENPEVGQTLALVARSPS